VVRVRFAPSPTGFLHVGNVRTALFNFLYARHAGGKFILRIEDTDRERSKPEYEEALQEDLKWLGINWDEGPFRQSERTASYNTALEKLKKGGHVYHCFCSPETLEAKRQAAQKEKRPPRYDGACRNLSEAQVSENLKKGIPFTYRFKIQDPKVDFVDLIKGPISVNLHDMVGDFVIARQDGSPLFHLTVCVDDAEMKITHVIRGEDHLSNTPRHILIFKALGAELPKFAHMPLILGEDGQPLSKRLGDFSVREFRRLGYPPDGVINYLALLGWSPGDNREILSREELESLFTIERVTASPARFDSEKFRWVRHEHFQRIEPKELVAQTKKLIDSELLAYYSDEGDAFWEERLLFLRENVGSYGELVKWFEMWFGFNRINKEKETEAVRNTSDFSQILDILKSLLESSKGVLLENATVYIDAIKPLGLKGEKLYKPLRYLLTGDLHGPELKGLLPLIPRRAALERLKKIEELISLK